MHRAHRRDAVHRQKFFFRKNLYSPQPGHACAPTSTIVPITPSALSGLPSYIDGYKNGARPSSPSAPSCSSHAGSRSHSPTHSTSGEFVPVPEFGPVEDEYGEFTIAEIINGDGKDFPGLMGVVGKYLDSLEIGEATRKELESSLQLIRRRADGESLLCS